MKQRNVLLLIQPAYPERIQGIARFAKSHGWHLTIVDRLARFPRGWRGDGALVTLRGNAETNRFVKGLVRQGIPVVDLTLNHPEMPLPRVSGDHEAFGRMARAHFEALNFRHFAWFSTAWSHVHELRFNGFRTPQAPETPLRRVLSDKTASVRQQEIAPEAPLRWVLSDKTASVRQQGMAPQAPLRWVLSEILSPDHIDDWRLFLRAVGSRLSDAPKPLAVLTYDDTDAAKVLAAARNVGLRVPEDVSIMGIGNDIVVCENQEVPLSSVDHDLTLNGYEGAALLDRLMNRKVKKIPKPRLLAPRGIVVRRSTDTFASDDPLLTAALHEIARRLGTSFGVNEIADTLNVSRTHLDQLFAKKFARSVGREIARQRIELAKKLLATTDSPMKEIAARCGFCNAGYFTNAFRAATGKTPKAWRS